MDKIIIKGLQLYAFHGVMESAKLHGQPFFIDLTAEANLNRVAVNDNIDETVNYAQLIRVVQNVFTSAKFNTIERAAQVICDAVLRNYPLVKRVNVVVKKPQAPVSCNVEYVAVELERSR